MVSENETKNETEELEVQTSSDGAGPRYHRVYSVDLPIAFERAMKTMAQLMADPNPFSPSLIASFEKTKGKPDHLEVDDEFMVHITGPWQGPVRVAQVTDTSFTLLTLEGHLEAGQIQFTLGRNPDGSAHFEIESVTRSKDKLVDFFYDKLRFAMFAQSKMWEMFCQNFAIKATGAGEAPEVQIRTEKQDRETGLWADVSAQLGAHGIA